MSIGIRIDSQTAISGGDYSAGNFQLNTNDLMIDQQVSTKIYDPLS